MDTLNPLYAVLRDHRNWTDIYTSGLEHELDGTLTLARVPALSDGKPIHLPPPYNLAHSGLAVGKCGDVYLSDGDHHRVIKIDGLHGGRTIVPGVGAADQGPGSFDTPGSLLLAGDRLYVADTGNQRLQVLQLPKLEVHAIWENPPQNPACLAADSQGRIYVLDRDQSQVIRFSERGVLDTAYHIPAAGLYIAIGEDDVLYTTDLSTQEILRFDVAAGVLGSLSIPWASFRAGALAAGNGKLYVHDWESGAIAVYDEAAAACLGMLPGYQGPVAAMTVDEIGNLYIKPNTGEQYYKLTANLAFVSQGMLEAGPLDAGEGSTWARVVVDVDVLDGTWAQLRLFVNDDREAAPSEIDWLDDKALASAFDTQVAPVSVSGDPPRTSSRYLWLRLLLESDYDRHSSPRIEQVRAEAAVENYLDYLPAIYAQQDAPRGLLESWLQLFRSEIGDLELQIDDIARLCDPSLTAEDTLPWLADWLAFDIPHNYEVDKLRSFLPDVHNLYRQRGTLDGLRQYIQLYTGAQAHIEEAYRQRGLWLLGQSSRLGFDTALSPALADGMVVPGPSLANSSYQGLLGRYNQTHANPNLKRSRFERIDMGLDFAETDFQQLGALAPISTSVIWTGQISPRYSEVYSFYVTAVGSISLWVDGQLIVENCHELAASEMTEPLNFPELCPDGVKTEYRGVIALTSEQWYTVTLKFSTMADALTLQLRWSSRSQSAEIVPANRLYAIQDDNIDIPTLQGSEADLEHFVVGETVVGEHGPLDKESFGEPLFSPTAHLFCVSIPAAQAAQPASREAIIQLIEAEKPAHTNYYLCFIEPRMRVGFQSRLGIDSIVAGPPEPMDLSGTTLGLDSYLGAEEGDVRSGRVGKHLRIGQDTLID